MFLDLWSMILCLINQSRETHCARWLTSSNHAGHSRRLRHYLHTIDSKIEESRAHSDAFVFHHGKVIETLL
jgi:hypothetical protein